MAVWGVVVGTTLRRPPAHVLEEIGIDRPGSRPEALFSLVTAGDSSSVGSTFLYEEPDGRTQAAAILQRAHRFVPEIEADVFTAHTVRSCARPVSFDGRPLIGAVPRVAGLYVCAGHGPWGISTGPASAQSISRQMLGLDEERVEFSPARLNLGA